MARRLPGAALSDYVKSLARACLLTRQRKRGTRGMRNAPRSACRMRHAASAMGRTRSVQAAWCARLGQCPARRISHAGLCRNAFDTRSVSMLAAFHASGAVMLPIARTALCKAAVRERRHSIYAVVTDSKTYYPAPALLRLAFSLRIVG